MQNEGRLLEGDMVYEKVWGQPMVGNSKALKTSISRLRKKVAGCGYTITTDYGNGYRFEYEVNK